MPSVKATCLPPLPTLPPPPAPLLCVGAEIQIQVCLVQEPQLITAGSYCLLIISRINGIMNPSKQPNKRPPENQWWEVF